NTDTLALMGRGEKAIRRLRHARKHGRLVKVAKRSFQETTGRLLVAQSSIAEQLGHNRRDPQRLSKARNGGQVVSHKMPGFAIGGQNGLSVNRGGFIRGPSPAPLGPGLEPAPYATQTRNTLPSFPNNFLPWKGPIIHPCLPCPADKPNKLGKPAKARRSKSSYLLCPP